MKLNPCTVKNHPHSVRKNNPFYFKYLEKRYYVPHHFIDISSIKATIGKKIKSNINQFINRISRKLISSELTHHISSFRLKSSFLKCWWATSLRGSGDQNLCFFMSLCFYLIAIIHCRLTFSSFGKLGPQDLSTRHKATKLQCDIHTLHCKLLTLEVKFNIYE